MGIYKIVITGGPCSGKSTALSRVKEYFEQHGYTVLLISEVATELITGGIAPWTCKSTAEYQSFVLKLQVEKEKVFEQAARRMDTEKVLIVCDRGVMDGKSYLKPDEFPLTVELAGISEQELRNRYNAVFHLVTAAKGSGDFYTVENNPARTETAEQAKILDDNLLSVWQDHPYFRVIENESSFENKLHRLLEEIEKCLKAEESK